MAATAAATGAWKIGVPAPVKSEKKPPTNFTRLTVRYPNCFLNTRPKVPAIRALGQEGNSSGGDDDTGISQEDVQFVLKMAAGSIAVGGGIKYGSIIFPEMTKPNIVQALIMVSTPVVVAIWLLINQSRQDRQS
ncbi:hypothetical protein SDJN02_20248 [Cucurbita argyrosperma subsp. argyrosperma]|uniref:Uncharacterized protein LOC111457518 isoform X1 n=1 Tax=Cucurbita moschata TaxID=3662 RepID=A0A6J1GTV4_CUCMO|nr:uncharacterized protein LOC111457518 isoform X1 [Cucurbita moschata]KAG7018380.1 hypothetical protein SDJN02_20248 [Cucurbita argyrosperma subsp. argyrosperma]